MSISKIDLQQKLIELIGQPVVLTCSSDPLKRNGFHPQVSVAGVLEAHPEDAHQWRVLVSADTYGYFGTTTVLALVERPAKPPVLYVGW